MSKDSNNMFIESWAAILLSLTALVTAWSAYQANLWTGTQSLSLTQAVESQMVLTKDLLAERQREMMDGIMVLEITKETIENRTQLRDALVPRLRQEIQKPILDWLALDPFKNSAAPAHPLLMPEYVKNVVETAAEKHKKTHQRYKQHMHEAQAAGSSSDSYVLLTVLFAAVLFFAGMASTFNIFRLQVALLVMATIIMAGALWSLYTLPIAFA